ncbi:PREDICTED: yjeF N-terminal domain-containing protein 3 [Cyprinodon variegatus]|uniref:yjeF N-terminal domain-containing protein 3 n=2 Tax=Cyprinodon TaxID=28741 RepID=UPI0007428EE1|nr:PREDICTED: yjeF N-terminal domain-containing protein 3 [Cyprinodon variegatus]
MGGMTRADTKQEHFMRSMGKLTVPLEREQFGCSKGDAVAIETELLRDYRFGQQQLIELWGQACALAITKAYPLSSLSKKQPTVLVICGPDQNGSVGLVCARHLRIFDYEPTIYHPKRSAHSLHQDFTIQCEKMDIPFLSYLPTEVQLINDAYNIVIDAMLGLETDSSNIKEPYSGILVTLKQIKIPIVSVDVPSGWNADEPSQDGINPEVLISLMAPKKCAQNFSGKHFLAGRFLPYDIQKKYELNIPDYAGTDCLLEL